MGAKVVVAAGGIIFIIGTFMAFAGPFLIPYLVQEKLYDYLVIDSTSAQQYDDWAGGYDLKNNYQMVFYFYNLTNPDDVRGNGAVPIYVEVGPYIYRRYRHSVNVSFQSGGNEMQFVDFRDYQYDFVASGNRSSSDVVVNLNPVFIAGMQQAGGEPNMMAAAVGGYIPGITNYFTGPFISLYSSMQLNVSLSSAINAQIAIINATQQDTDSAMAYFLNVWCNSTVAPQNMGNWTGLLMASGGVPTNITLASALALTDAQTPYSLLDSSLTSAWAWNQALSNDTYSAILENAFSITKAQIALIMNWKMNSFDPVFIHPQLIEQYGLDSISDLGWVQWTSGTVLGTEDNPLDMYTLFPIGELGYSIPIELFVIVSPTFFPDWRFSKKVMDPVSGLENLMLYQAFLFTISQNENANFSMWNMNTSQAGAVYGYAAQMTANLAPYLVSTYGESGGLVLTQSVDEWVFNCNRVLVDLLIPHAPTCSFLSNHSVYSTDTIITGKKNISQINEYVSWQGQQVIKGIWQGDLAVSGVTELGQFAPYQDKGGVLLPFDDNFVRTMQMDYVNTTTVNGISAYQYMLNYTNTFSPSNFYYQNIPGFANMTTVKQSPIFFSLWDMLYVNESIRNMVVGLNNTSTEFDDNTIIDVEPITGNTIGAKKRLQINLYVPDSCSWCVPSMPSAFGNSNLTSNTFFPIAKAGEYVVIGDDLAKMLRGKLNQIHDAKHLGFIIGIAVGAGLAVVGAALFFQGCRMRMRDGYKPINP